MGKRGGSCWFAVDSKSFEISVDVLGKKLKGIIVERSRGFTLWIRGEFGQNSSKAGNGGRRFKLECRANEAGRFLLCSVVDSDAKRHCLVFPKENVSWKRWGFEGKGKKEKSYVDAVNTRGVSRVRRLREAAWLQLGEEDVSRGRELLDRCLVGRWEKLWFQFHTCVIWKAGEKVIGNSKEIRFCTWKVDESTVALKELQWARLLVKSEGTEWPSSLQVVIDTTCFAIQLWWEVLPRVSKVLLAIRNGSGKEQEAREEEGGTYALAAWTDMEAPLSDLMSTRGVEVDKSKRWQQSVGNNSKTGPVAAKGILGWDVELAVKRRPIVEGLEA
ncbi:hypothetical protein CK203_057893 [Vitis vinifera]|uniref:DUF4283 domain-containing protein n=1 Tax=Vitis vinifera TaxID=29760 RepID=A0A438GSB9_VITVI|nr:hypothetical protein CK203_057893 [Vitis vinifera]